MTGHCGQYCLQEFTVQTLLSHWNNTFHMKFSNPNFQDYVRLYLRLQPSRPAQFIT